MKETNISLSALIEEARDKMLASIEEHGMTDSWILAELYESITQAFHAGEATTKEEIAKRFEAMQQRYPEFCLELLYDKGTDYVVINTTRYERIEAARHNKPSN